MADRTTTKIGFGPGQTPPTAEQYRVALDKVFGPGAADRAISQASVQLDSNEIQFACNALSVAEELWRVNPVALVYSFSGLRRELEESSTLSGKSVRNLLAVLEHDLSDGRGQPHDLMRDPKHEALAQKLRSEVERSGYYAIVRGE